MRRQVIFFFFAGGKRGDERGNFPNQGIDGARPALLHGLQQRHFEIRAFAQTEFHAALAGVERVEHAQKLLRAHGRSEQRARAVPAHGIQQRVADAALRVRESAQQVAPFLRKLVGAGDDRRAVAARHRRREIFDFLLRGEPVNVRDVAFGNFFPAEGNDLVENRLRIAHPAVGEARDGDERGAVGFHAVVFRDFPQPRGDFLFGNRLKFEALAARRDRFENFVRLRRREDELDEFRRLFDDFEQRVEGVLGKLVNFVDDVDFVTALHRRIIAFLADLLRVVDAAVRRRVDFRDVRAGAVDDGAANRIVLRRGNARAVRAVERLREDARRRRLPGPARTDEKISVSDAPGLNRVFQRADDVFLPDDFVELLRSPAPRDDLKTLCHSADL